MYCPECGQDHHAADVETEATVAVEAVEAAAAGEVGAAAEISDAQVEIARINADRDISLARISAKMADAEAAAVVEQIEVAAELGEPEAEPGLDAEPVVVVDADAEAEADPTAPPETEPAGTPEPETADAGPAKRDHKSAWWG